MLNRRTALLALLAATGMTNAVVAAKPPRLQIAFGGMNMSGLEIIFSDGTQFVFDEHELQAALKDGR